MKCNHRWIITDRSYFTQYRKDMSIKEYVEKFEFKCLRCFEFKWKSVSII